MLIVVTGQPRHGKTQFSIKKLLDYIKANDKREDQGKEPRTIYCDIAGVNDDDTPIKLPSVLNQWEEFGDSKLWFGELDDPQMPEGYIIPKEGSIFIYDECHKVDWIKDTSGALSKNPTTISMNEHGHRDLIFILITQFPQYIHTHLRGLVEDHYHTKRFSGFKSATVYLWNEFVVTPRARTAIKNVTSKQKFVFKDKYQDCYKSASSHDSMKLRIPREWFMALALILFFVVAMLWRFNNSPIKSMVMEGETDIMKANASHLANTQTVDNPIQAQAPLEQSTEQLQADEIEQLREQYLQPHIIEMTKHDDILPTMAMAMGDKCHAYNRYNERLNIDDTTCRKLLTSGGMPKSRTYNENSNNDNSNSNMEVRHVEPIDLNRGG